MVCKVILGEYTQKMPGRFQNMLGVCSGYSEWTFGAGEVFKRTSNSRLQTKPSRAALKASLRGIEPRH